MTADHAITALILAAIVGYALAFAVLFASARKFARVLGGLAWLANLAVFLLNWHHLGEPPFGNMYQVKVVLGLCFLPLFLVLRRRGGMDWLAPHFLLASALPLVGTLFLERNLQWRRMPALQSPWFVPHVLGYMLSYALLTVAFAALVWGLYLRWRQSSPELLLRSRQAVYAITRMAFPLMTFGLLSGALWAEEAWGIYWSWDPKETWSLITWTLYLIYFHARLSPRTRRFEIAAHLLAFAALLVTFLLVNLLPKLGGGLHSYS